MVLTILSRCKLVKAECTIVSRSTRTRFQDVMSKPFEFIFKRKDFKYCGLVKIFVQVSEDCKEQLNRRQVWITFMKIQTNNFYELLLSGNGGRGLQVRCESDQRLWPRACCAAVCQGRLDWFPSLTLFLPTRRRRRTECTLLSNSPLCCSAWRPG